MKKFLFLIFLFFPIVLLAQIKVTGVVLSNLDRKPLIGATVSIKNTETGVITDINGEFEIITFQPTDVLVCSYVGFATQELIINDTSFVEFIMDEDFLNTEVGFSFPIEINYWEGILTAPYGIKGAVSIKKCHFSNEILTASHSPSYVINFSGGYQTNFLYNQNYFMKSSLYLKKLRPSVEYKKINFRENFLWESIYFSNTIFLKLPLIGYSVISPKIGKAYLRDGELNDILFGFGGVLEKGFHMFGEYFW